jgi:hypothetical protein
MRFRRKLRLFALTTLVVWLGAVYHDVWLAAADLAHHHDHAHHHEHHQDSDNDSSDSIPLLDFHAIPFVVSNAISVPQSFVWSDGPNLSTLWLEHFKAQCVDCANAPPPPSDLHETRRVFSLRLSNSVQPNAPPVFA